MKYHTLKWAFRSSYQRIWKDTYLNRPRDSLCLPGKPPRKAQSIINLSQTLRNRLSCLISNNLRQILFILSDQRIPLQKPLSTCPGINFFERLKCSVSSLNGCIYVGCIIIGCCGPCLTGSRIWWRFRSQIWRYEWQTVIWKGSKNLRHRSVCQI